MNRRKIPAWLGEQAAIALLQDDDPVPRLAGDVEFDVRAWLCGVKVPPWKPASIVPDPKESQLVLEVLFTAQRRGSNSPLLFSAFLPAHLWEDQKGHPGMWANDYDSRGLEERRGVSHAKGPWRVWPATELRNAVDLVRPDARQTGDHRFDAIRDALRQLDTPGGTTC